MSPAPPEEATPGLSGLRLLDLAALVLGFGMAALLVRAGVRGAGPLSGFEMVVLGFSYLWMGLAMSGPFVLIPGRRPVLTPRDDDDPQASWSGGGKVERARRPKGPEPAPYTWAETAWLLIGAYWVAVAVLLVPTRLPVGNAGRLGLLPVAAALVLWVLRPRPTPKKTTPRPGWTHATAVVVLSTWPFAWVAQILLTAVL